MLHLYPSTEKRSILIKDIVAALDKAAKGVKDAGSRKEEESQVLNTSMAEDPDVDRISNIYGSLSFCGCPEIAFARLIQAPPHMVPG